MVKKIALVGATGNVGRLIARQLLGLGIVNPEGLRLFASAKSAGSVINIDNRLFTVENTHEAPWGEFTMAVFATESDISQTYVPEAMKAGCVVIDTSSAYRMSEGVPLVVAPVNGTLIDPKRTKQYSTPNCLASPISVVAAPLHKAFGIRTVAAVTYQSVSGAGKGPMDELLQETRARLDGDADFRRKHFRRQIAFNLFPQVGSFEEDGFTGEERKIMQEVVKILGDDTIKVTATAARVPVLVGHSIALQLTFTSAAALDDVRKVLTDAPGVKLSEDHYSTPVEVQGQDNVYVGRLRRDPTCENGILLWTCSDNLRRGASTDVVEIAGECLRKL